MLSSPAVLPDETVDHHADVLVVGGGLHGCAIARDLAGRGWRVLLCEQDDLAAHASGATGKLVHGGLRELARLDLGGVKRALLERHRLLHAAPHLLSPVRLVMPHDDGMRTASLIRLGLWWHDQLAADSGLAPSEAVGLRRSRLGALLQPGWSRAFVYTEVMADDTRLAVLCARDAAEQGALVLTRTRCEQAVPREGGWRATLARRDPAAGQVVRRLQVQARVVVNAAGAWAPGVLGDVLGLAPAAGALQNGEPAGWSWQRSTHMVVPRCSDPDHGCVFHTRSGRFVFALPYERHFTLIGAVEHAHQGALDVAASAQDIGLLCEEVGRYLIRPPRPEDVVWAYAGLRGSPQRSRRGEEGALGRHLLQAQVRPAPVLTVWGGTLSSFRLLAEQAADQVGDLLSERRLAWTAEAALPGGLLGELLDKRVSPELDMLAFQSRLRQRHPWLDLPLLRRWTRAYGSRVLRLLDGVRGRGDLGAEVLPDLFEAELYHLRRQEWAMTAEDVLWRRSKLGLHATPAQREALADWFARQHCGTGQADMVWLHGATGTAG